MTSAMAREIAEIPAAAARALDQGAIAGIAAGLRRARPRFVVTCGRGSSGHAAVHLRYLIETRLGLVVSASAPSVITAYGVAPAMDGALFIAVSQSGRGPDVLAALDAAKRAGARTLALVNDEASPLAARCEQVIALRAGPETSIAATKSVVATLVAGAALVAAWAGDRALEQALARLPGRLDAALLLDWSDWGRAVGAAPCGFVAGRGYSLAIAREIALKLCETLLVPALAFSSAELLHGPRAALAADRPLLILRQDDESAPLTDDTIARLTAQGVRAHIAGGVSGLPWLAPDHAALDVIAMLAPAYRAIEVAARALGFDPDRPPHLAKITRTL